MTVRIEFDAARCAGHALCAAAGPDLFILNDAGYCIPPSKEVPPELAEQAFAGADACPEQAIAVVDERTVKAAE